MTMGECLAAGASWNNWTGQAASVTTIPTTPNASYVPTWDYQTQAPDADDGCLHCHSTTVEYNGPAERFKSSYLMTGHKNMLRKVTAGKNWAGPDADGVMQVYTAYAAGNDQLDHRDRQGQSASTKSLLYIFGDWMAPAPAGLDVIVNVSGCGKVQRHQQLQLRALPLHRLERQRDRGREPNRTLRAVFCRVEPGGVHRGGRHLVPGDRREGHRQSHLCAAGAGDFVPGHYIRAGPASGTSKGLRAAGATTRRWGQ